MAANYSVDLDLGNRAAALAMALASPLGHDAALALGATLSAPLLAEQKRRRRYERRKAAERGEIIRSINDGLISAGLYSPAELYALENADTLEECATLIAKWEAWERRYGPTDPPSDQDLYDLCSDYEDVAA